MARYVLQYTEMAWWIIDAEDKSLMNKDIIGYARDVQLLRDGPDVLITSDTLGCPKSVIIPSDTIIKGFGQAKNGKAIWEVTNTGTIYNSALRPVSGQGIVR